MGSQRSNRIAKLYSASEDLDGAGQANVSDFRPSDRGWYLLRFASGFSGAQFDLSSDKIIPADYNDGGKADTSVFRDGAWYLQRSTASFTGVAFDAANDKPVPNAFVP